MNSDDTHTPFIRRLARCFTPLILLLGGGAAWAYFHSTAPRIEKQRPQATAAVVETISAESGDVEIVIQGMGTVVASREVTLKARVSGDILRLCPQFVPGGRIPQGAEILRIDPADYEVALAKAGSALEEARADQRIEEGSQTIAREELRLLSETAGDTVLPTDLALRKPQLQQAQAAVASAEADLLQAKLDLKRTVVTAPFNAMITERSVNMGTHANTQDSLVTLVDTDEYWVEVAIPVDQLKHLDLAAGSKAVVHSQTTAGERVGRAVRTTGSLSDATRMATVIVAVSDPLGLDAGGETQPLVLGDYVSVEIEGRPMTSVLELPRSALRDGDTVWVYADGRLEIRSVNLAWKAGDRVLLNGGVAAGEHIIVSDLSFPVRGMKLTQSADASTSTKAPVEPAAPKAG
jgi:RND family efflux transporter MFP subunit